MLRFVAISNCYDVSAYRWSKHSVERNSEDDDQRCQLDKSDFSGILLAEDLTVI